MQMLVEQHMLTAAEEQELLSELSFRPEDRWIQLLYRCATRGVGHPRGWDTDLVPPNMGRQEGFIGVLIQKIW